MAIEEDAYIPSLEAVEQAEVFGGFTPEDFAIFEVPGFAARMPLLRAQIKPKLTQVGAALTSRLAEPLGETVHPHVAQHLRRTVNPPVETWVAFARSPRAYKPFTHLRVAISGERVRVTVFVEDDSEEKLTFAENLRNNAEELARYFAHHPAILAWDIPDVDGEPQRGSALDADTLRAFADRLRRVKGQHACFGLSFAPTHPVVQSGPEFLDAVVEAADTLRPLYDCGACANFRYLYTPEIIAVGP